ncbi:MAG: endonuclease/exonuclease/phosphatase family protein [Phycisphaerales bacterium JB039]
MTVAPPAQAPSDSRRPGSALPAVAGAAIALGAAVLPWTPLWLGDLLASVAPALGLVLGLGAAVALLARRRRAAALLGLVAASAAGLTIWSPRAPAGAGTATFTLVAVNAHMTEPEAFVRFLEATDADIVAVVEAPWNLHQTAVPATFAFRHIEGPRTGGPAVRGLYSRWPGRLVAADLPDRSVFGAEIDHPAGPLGVVVLHALSPRTPARWREGNQRTRQAGQLAAQLEAGGACAVIAGDFNSPPTGLRSRALGAMGFRRARPRQGPGGSYPAWLWQPLGLAIDGAALGDGLAVQSWRVLDLPGSDHRAVRIEIALADQ